MSQKRSTPMLLLILIATVSATAVISTLLQNFLLGYVSLPITFGVVLVTGLGVVRRAALSDNEDKVVTTAPTLD